MLASSIISRARSLADLQNSKSISYDDEKNSLNEGYKIIYNKLCESDDDFFVTDYTFANMQTYLTATPYNYELPLPVDFYKLRTVTYNFNGNWYPMSRMPLNLRNVNTAEPYYRLKNNMLWIVCGSTSNVGSVKISYYPPPETLSLPDKTVAYPSLTIARTITLPQVWCMKDINTLYKATGNTLVRYDNNKTTPTTIYTGASATSWPVYYRNLLYFYEGTVLKYIDLASLAVTTIQSGVNPAYPISVNSDKLFYIVSGKTKENSWLGGDEQALSDDIWYCIWLSDSGGTYTYVTNGDIEINGVVVPGLGTVEYMAYPFFNKTYSAGVYTLVDNTMRYDNAKIGAAWNGNAIAMSTLDNSLMVMSTAEDSSLTYPTNVIYEILSYFAACDFKRKYDSVNADMEKKLAALFDAFENSTIRRDEYKAEKIQNVYNIGTNWGNL